MCISVVHTYVERNLYCRKLAFIFHLYPLLLPEIILILSFFLLVSLVSAYYYHDPYPDSSRYAPQYDPYYDPYYDSYYDSPYDPYYDPRYHRPPPPPPLRHNRYDEHDYYYYYHRPVGAGYRPGEGEPVKGGDPDEDMMEHGKKLASSTRVVADLIDSAKDNQAVRPGGVLGSLFGSVSGSGSGGGGDQAGLGDALGGLSSLMREGADMMEHVPGAFITIKDTFEK